MLGISTCMIHYQKDKNLNFMMGSDCVKQSQFKIIAG